MNVLNLPRPGWMTEDLVLLEEQARRFIAAEYVPHLDTWNEEGRYDREVWNKAGAAGLLCPAIPEEYGGAGGTFAHEAVIGRELSFAGFDSFGAPLHSGIVAPYILHYGTDEQKKRWLPKLVTGELVGAIAMSEPGTGSDLQGVRTTAKKSGNGYVLNGSKTFITNGQHANLIIVVAKTDAGAGAKGVSLMVVETEDASGFRRGRKLKKLGLDSADTSELFFEDVKLPAENLLGREEGQGFAQLMNDLPRPAWMSEDVVLLEETARRFISAEYGPHLEKWHEDHFYPREVWTKAGAAGLLCASMPEEYGGAGGTFAHEAVIDRQCSLAGFDAFGAPLHSGIVAPYILHYGTEEQKKRWLPKLATGELVGAIAMSEPGTGSDL